MSVQTLTQAIFFRKRGPAPTRKMFCQTRASPFSPQMAATACGRGILDRGSGAPCEHFFNAAENLGAPGVRL